LCVHVRPEEIVFLIYLISVACTVFHRLFFFLLFLEIFVAGLNYLNHISNYRSHSGYIIYNLSPSAFNPSISEGIDWRILLDYRKARVQ
jgi:hypothetical protein